MLGLSLEAWNNIMLLSLGAAATSAVVVGISTYAVVRLQRAEAADAASEFERYRMSVASQVADAKSEGIAAGKAAGNALLRAAELEKRAAELKAANLVLEAQIQPRRLSSEQATKFSAALSAAKLPIVVVSRMFDTEGKDFADDLAGAFNQAGWQAVRYENWTRPDRGVSLATVEGTPLLKEVEAWVGAALKLPTLRTRLQLSAERTSSACPRTSSRRSCICWSAQSPRLQTETDTSAARLPNKKAAALRGVEAAAANASYPRDGCGCDQHI